MVQVYTAFVRIGQFLLKTRENPNTTFVQWASILVGSILDLRDGLSARWRHVMKKFALLIVLFVLLFGVLITGCSSSGSSDDQEDENPVTPPVDPPTNPPEGTPNPVTGYDLNLATGSYWTFWWDWSDKATWMSVPGSLTGISGALTAQAGTAERSATITTIISRRFRLSSTMKQGLRIGEKMWCNGVVFPTANSCRTLPDRLGSIPVSVRSVPPGHSIFQFNAPGIIPRSHTGNARFSILSTHICITISATFPV